MSGPTPELLAHVESSRRWRELMHHVEVDSTNDHAAASLAAGTRHGVVVVADHQRAGRGRRGRVWEDHPADASLLASVTVPPPPAVTHVPLAAGLAVVEAVAAVGLEAAVKWPNDVVVPRSDGEAKLAGVLTEGHAGGIVVGIGVNVDHRGLPRIEGSTSVAAELDHDVDRWSLLDALLRALDVQLTLLESDRPAAVLDHYRARCATLGRDVVVELASADRITGHAVDLTADGALVVAAPGGRRLRVTAGDVHHVRPVTG